ncbi:hypothetical protein Poli38472_014867 [Pythium oligandrum]|uniref:DUF6604 domain-containing protein n=1 Tax=Pythium oligandrum TaxID=41045 RepID=A0A8K1C1Z1_PYTOL|nr:hypothetical protein Poli38472_014867 [Pythium oligandrum]|eukprot:TMW54933.1 hypothetical protein Poli38472_014867 [Pythium oligandrum]
MSFPGHIYGKYKHATQFFLDWMLRAGASTGASPAPRNASIRVLQTAVDELVGKRKSLGSDELRELPLALTAFQIAITLREHVASFFDAEEANTSGSEDTHAHFLNSKKTLVEATAVAKVAIQCATSAIARFQLKYPSVRDADDVFTLLEKHLSSSPFDLLSTLVIKEWYKGHRAKVKVDAVPGGIIVDFSWVGSALLSFRNDIPIDHRVRLSGEGFGKDL